MDLIWQVYGNGGAIMHVMLLLWVAGLVACIVQFRSLRRVNLIPTITGLTVLILLLGCCSYALVQLVAGEVVDQLWRTGPRVELEVIMSKRAGTNMAGLLFSLGFGMVLTFLGGIAATLRVNLRAPDFRSGADQ